MHSIYGVKFLPEEILVYLRKSRSDDPNLTTEEVLSNHRKILDDWVERNLDRPIPEENYYLEVSSGEKLESRPAMMQVLKQIENPKFSAILCVECSRLSRGDLMDCGLLIRNLRYSGTKVITPYKTYDLSDEYDRDFFERELKRGNEYLEYTKKILKRGTYLSVSSGWYVSSVPVYGYDKITVMDGKRKRPTLAINEEEAKVVRMVYDMYVNQDMSVDKIAYRIQKMGILGRNGKPFPRSTVRDMLGNPHYIGKIRWNYRKEEHIVKDYEVTVVRRPTQDYMLFEGKHPAILDEDIFYSALNKVNNTPRVNSFTELRNPLAGLLYCKTCKTIMISGTDNQGRRRVKCRNYMHCHNASVEVASLLKDICDVLEKELGSITANTSDKSKKETKNKEQEVKFLEKKLKDLEEKEVSLWEKYAEEGMPRNIFESLREKNVKEREQVMQTLKETKEELESRPSNIEERIVTLSEAISAIRDDDAPVELQNKLLKACINRITYDRILPEELIGKRGNQKRPEYDIDIDLKL